MKMFNFLTVVAGLGFQGCFPLLSIVGVSFIGCFPIQMDATLTWGGNQTVRKTLDVNQVQTDAQVASGSEIVGDVLSGVVAVAPLLLREVPQPTPVPKYEIIGPVLPTLPPMITPTPPPVRRTYRVNRRKRKAPAAVPQKSCTQCCPWPKPLDLENEK